MAQKDMSTQDWLRLLKDELRTPVTLRRMIQGCTIEGANCSFTSSEGTNCTFRRLKVQNFGRFRGNLRTLKCMMHDGACKIEFSRRPSSLVGRRLIIPRESNLRLPPVQYPCTNIVQLYIETCTPRYRWSMVISHCLNFGLQPIDSRSAEGRNLGTVNGKGPLPSLPFQTTPAASP